ncbi:MAG: cell division protein FtsQ/DivIB [Aristaeellaceae bacterium]
MLWTLAVLILLSGLFFWLWSCAFVLRSVVVQGGSLDSEKIVAAAGVMQGQSVFTLDESEIRENIDALGTVCLEEYELRLPDKLLLRVRDREPAAMLPCEGKLLLIDGEGYSIELVEDAPDTDLLYLNGVEVADFYAGQVVEDGEGRMALCRRIVAALEEMHAAMYVSEIDLRDPSAPRIITRSGILAELDADALEAELRLMKAAVADLEARGARGGRLCIESGSRADYSPGTAAT